jgi:hypothetical protein
MMISKPCSSRICRANQLTGPSATTLRYASSVLPHGMQACAHLLAHRRVLGEVRKCDRSVLLHRARLRQ